MTSGDTAGELVGRATDDPTGRPTGRSADDRVATAGIRRIGDPRPPAPTRRRASAPVTLLSLAAVVAVGLQVARFGSAGWADMAGGALYAAMAVLIARLVLPAASPWVQAVLGLGWCWLVEFAQLTEVPVTVVDAFPPARFVLGTTFNAADLVAYAVGAAGCAAVIVLSSRRWSRPR